MASRVERSREFPRWIQKPAKRLPHLRYYQHHSKFPRKREPENPDFDIFWATT